MTQKTHLPKDEVSFIDSLERPAAESRLRALWEAGWSLSILGDSLSPARPKTTIHFWVKRATPVEQKRPIPHPLLVVLLLLFLLRTLPASAPYPLGFPQT